MARCFYTILLLFSGFVLHAQSPAQPYILVLGIAQDGGYPHIGCQHQCCNRAWASDSLKRSVVSLALVDPVTKKWWLFEATPDIRDQLHSFQCLTHGAYNFVPEGIFVTHAHIGHYAGLMQLGKEAMSAHEVPVYALPRMSAFLETNGPWSQLVILHNIALRPLQADTAVALTDKISVTAFTVPHRDEYSETAGFRIMTGSKKYLFIPDINKWNLWDRNITNEVKKVDVAFVDATFYAEGELPGRNLASVPHPFVTETMELFKNEAPETKAKVYLIHFNHSNPMLWDRSKQNEVKKQGFHVCIQGEKI